MMMIYSSMRPFLAVFFRIALGILSPLLFDRLSLFNEVLVKLSIIVQSRKAQFFFLVLKCGHDVGIRL